MGDCPGLGGWQKICLCVLGVIPYDGEEHINEIPAHNPWTILCRFVYVFFVRLFFVPEKRAHESLAHNVLSPQSPVFPVGYLNRTIYVPWVLKIVHKHLTPGLRAGRLPGHRRGYRPNKIYVHVPFSFLMRQCCCATRAYQVILQTSSWKIKERIGSELFVPHK